MRYGDTTRVVLTRSRRCLAARMARRISSRACVARWHSPFTCATMLRKAFGRCASLFVLTCAVPCRAKNTRRFCSPRRIRSFSRSARWHAICLNRRAISFRCCARSVANLPLNTRCACKRVSPFAWTATMLTNARGFNMANEIKRTSRLALCAMNDEIRF